MEKITKLKNKNKIDLILQIQARGENFVGVPADPVTYTPSLSFIHATAKLISYKLYQIFLYIAPTFSFSSLSIYIYLTFIQTLYSSSPHFILCFVGVRAQVVIFIGNLICALLFLLLLLLLLLLPVRGKKIFIQGLLQLPSYVQI